MKSVRREVVQSRLDLITLAYRVEYGISLLPRKTAISSATIRRGFGHLQWALVNIR
jgi:hypothetical protein